MENQQQNKYKFVVQGSDEWLELRKQHGCTASRLGTIIGCGYISRNAYMRIKLQDLQTEINPLMQYGLDHEDWVAHLYARFMRNNQEPVTLSCEGFRELDDDPRSGGSVDRIVTSDRTGDQWVLEIKCRPKGDTRTEVPISHICQCVMNAIAYKCDFSDYISFSPETREVFISRITFDKQALWDRFLIHKIRNFNDLWQANEYYPPRMRAGERQANASVVKTYTHTRPIFHLEQESSSDDDGSSCK